MAETKEKLVTEEQQQVAEEVVSKAEFLKLLEEAQNLNMRYAKLVEVYNMLLEKYLGGK